MVPMAVGLPTDRSLYPRLLVMVETRVVSAQRHLRENLTRTHGTLITSIGVREFALF